MSIITFNQTQILCHVCLYPINYEKMYVTQNLRFLKKEKNFFFILRTVSTDFTVMFLRSSIIDPVSGRKSIIQPIFSK